MPILQEKHPATLRDLIGQSIYEGMPAQQVVDRLAEGTLPGWEGAYTVPVSTAYYYGQVTRKRNTSAGLTPRAKGDLDEAITQMAREIISELDNELKAARQAKTRDLEKLGDIVKVLKDTRGLITPRKGTPGLPPKPEEKPKDPLLAALEKASQPKA